MSDILMAITVLSTSFFLIALGCAVIHAEWFRK